MADPGAFGGCGETESAAHVMDRRALQATDLDWSYGSGPPLRGKAEDLALVLCGRALPAGRIEGEPL